MYILTTTLLALSVSYAKPCTDVICQSGVATPEYWYCDSDDYADAVCSFGDLGWTVALSSENCEMSEDFIDDDSLQSICRPVNVASEVLNNQRKLDTILHNMGLRGPLVEDCASGDQWCVHIVENGSTQLDAKFKGSKVLQFAHDNVKDWLYQELVDAGLFDENMRDPMQCFEGMKNVHLSADFHRNCDDLGVFTVTFVRTIEDGSIFGLVTTKPFSDSLDDPTDDGAFMFSLYSGISEQASGFRINGKAGKVKHSYSSNKGPHINGFQIGNLCMKPYGQDKGGATSTSSTWVVPETEWEKSHMRREHGTWGFSYRGHKWFMCENLEVWVVSPSSASS